MAKTTGKTAATAEGSKQVAESAPDDVVAQEAAASAAEVPQGDEADSQATVDAVAAPDGSEPTAEAAPDDVVAENAATPAAEVPQGDEEANQDIVEAAAVSPAPAVPAGHVVVRFVRDHEVQDENRGTKNATIYACGAELPLPEASAQHFVSRGIAERI